MTIAFDTDKDGMLDTSSGVTGEMRIIRNACKDDSYDYNVFVVSKPSTKGLLPWACGRLEPKIRIRVRGWDQESREDVRS
jgi:hypothetical protein